MAKQTIYNARIYVRLSQEDMRAGESLSIENQKLILTKYVKEQGWNLIDIYVDDGFSGTNFDRPGVQKLLDDAQVGRINLIIVKDLSRFGRNYIEVGRYIDYIFPLHNIRFIALNDNVDTASKDSVAMDMMPIINLFNEWHASSTSKKIRAVVEANAKAGKYKSTYPPYGYVKGEAPNHLPVIDPEAAAVVRRIFEMRAQGISPWHICYMLNSENIPIPSDYYYNKIGKRNPRRTKHLWGASNLRRMLSNPVYLGHLVQLKTTTVSYKNHKKVNREPEDMVIIENAHEPIISQELWDKVREVENSVSQGMRTKLGDITPLSGPMYCEDCGDKMHVSNSNINDDEDANNRRAFNCSSYNRFGKIACTSHFITYKDMEDLIISDIKSMSQCVMTDEATARKIFLKKKEQQTTDRLTADKKQLTECKYRLKELEELMQSVYEDKVLGKVPENICLNFLQKYEAEQKELAETVDALETKLSKFAQNEEDVDEFIARLKKYCDTDKLTREMCLELIEYITIDKNKKGDPREIHIYYKFLNEPLKNSRSLY